ncbi:hypothetical protein AB1Y20_020047 [Prymnesium parvum]|uniref:Mitochondrial import inner membrane translocase subunit TIM22 n=1 Tax=Prymnesium parvum TaxID=97485 RepID=A0AB34JWA8_PRYPA
MSSLASRGGPSEVRADAALSPEAAKAWLEQAQAATSDEQVCKRKEARATILRDAGAAGACAGVVGAASGWAALKARPEFRRAVGGSGAAFFIFSTFFVPCMFVANRCRGRWQRGKSFFDKGDPSF